MSASLECVGPGRCPSAGIAVRQRDTHEAAQEGGIDQMRKLRLRRPRASAAQPVGATSESPYSTMCWVMQPATSQPLAPAQLSVAEGNLHLQSDASATTVQPCQALDRLAQIDVWATDVDLLFFETANSLALTTLRFPSDDAAQAFLTRLIESYERRIGTRFPQDWLHLHKSRDRTEE